MDSYALARSQVEAFLERISRHIVFLRIDGGPQVLSVGTGFLASHRGKVFVVTAYHVVNDSLSEGVTLSFHIKSDEPLRFQDPGDLTDGQPLSPTLQLNGVDHHYVADVAHDIAAFSVADSANIPPHIEPFIIENGCVENLCEGASLVTTGIPINGGFVDSNGNHALLPWHDHTRFSSSIDLSKLKDVDADSQFAYDYSLHLDGLESAQGFSGAPVWANKNPDCNIWLPSPKLAGIAVKQFKKSQLFLAVKPLHIVALLDQAQAQCSDH